MKNYWIWLIFMFGIWQRRDEGRQEERSGSLNWFEYRVLYARCIQCGGRNAVRKELKPWSLTSLTTLFFSFLYPNNFTLFHSLSLSCLNCSVARDRAKGKYITPTLPFRVSHVLPLVVFRSRSFIPYVHAFRILECFNVVCRSTNVNEASRKEMTRSCTFNVYLASTGV